MGVRIKSSHLGALYVSVSYDYGRLTEYEYRRIGDQWEMLGNSGEWFACAPQNDTMRAVHDYENCLHAYTFEESAQNLERQAKPYLKNIFAPVRLTYNAAAENRARFNREYNVKRLTRPGEYQKRLTQ